ncbi:hypothetical protein J3E74DRAFT_469548 [Bipolaris maydis]|nr:hypothetical protein J3E74DRAFT_469548 [Bipolaris maydis]
MSASPTIAASSTKRPLEEPSADAIDIAQPVKAEAVAVEGISEEQAKVVPVATPRRVRMVLSLSRRTLLSLMLPLFLRPSPSNPHLVPMGRPVNSNQQNVTTNPTLSGAKCTVSDYSRGAVERILTVSGQVDAVFQGIWSHCRYPMRLLIPHILIGSIIGKAGVPDRAIRGPAASQYATRSGMAANVPAGGQYSHPQNFRRQEPAQRTPAHGGGYGAPHMHGQPPQQSPYGHPNMPYGAASPSRGPYGGPAAPTPLWSSPGCGACLHMVPLLTRPLVPSLDSLLTQQIFIPNDMVGAIIGKGGAKINEIRQLSGSVIKINEPTDNSNERLVTITGTQECNQMALYMLYSRTR